MINIVNLLTVETPEKRLENLAVLLEKEADNNPEQQQPYFVNNHIHTSYSFSPYSPAMSIWMARRAGLHTAGIMDHDSVAGAREFTAAGALAGIATTAGIECRADFSATPLAGRRINHPDQESVAYVAIHGIPAGRLDRVDAFFAPYREHRNRRNRSMTEKLNRVTEPFHLHLDFDNEILPLSCHSRGGTVTERHLLFALAGKILGKYSQGGPVIDFLSHKLQVDIAPRNLAALEETDNPFYAYDILNVLKGSLMDRFYIAATAECPDIRDVLALSEAVGAVSAYAYLGDITDSVTGDKKACRFEDTYLDLLFDTLQQLGFRAVTYMPTRNTLDQLRRVQELCNRYGFFQICGEDINSPRQSFVCPKLQDPQFSHLVEAAWALIGHEQMSNTGGEGFFAGATLARYPDLAERTRVFSCIAREQGGNL